MKKLLFVLLVLFGVSLPVFAAPPFLKGMPEPKELPGPTLQERFGMPPSNLMRAPASYPTPTVNILFLKVDFQPDQDLLTTGSGEWSDPLYAYPSNSNGDPDYWVNQAKTRFVDYWNEVSYGLLPIQITVSSKVYRLPNPMSSYGDETDRALQNFIYDSITSASTDTLQPITDFRPYDAVLIVHAGVGQESDITQSTPNDIWSLYYQGGSICKDLSNNCLLTQIKDGSSFKLINEAIIMPQTDSRVSPNFTLDPLGVYVHEFGHWLGLPDLYCTAPSTCTIDPAGSWSLMAYGSYNPIDGKSTPAGSLPAHLDAWSLVKLGWVIPQQVSLPENILTLGPVETVPPPAVAAAGTGVLKATASTATTNEYFLIENRQQKGFDAGLPGHGLLVWEIDAVQVDNTIGSNSINNDQSHLGIQLLEADGDKSLILGTDVGSAGDPFPGSTINTLLSPVTNPSSVPYTNFGWVNIRNISEVTGDVSFNLGFALLPPQNPAIDTATKTITWDMNVDAVSYHVYKNGFSVPVSVPADGNAPFYTDSTNQPTDYYVITAVDKNDNESQASVRVPPQSSSTVITTSGGGNACFIATAAYGSYLDPHVKVLRTFRDRYLLTNRPGRALVAFYYRNSPPLADYISRHEGLRTVTRWALTPVVFAAEYFRVLMLIVPVLCLVVVIGLVRKRRGGSGFSS